jgi:acetyl-CoA carboxylase biotin carboxyl carrier protein
VAKAREGTADQEAKTGGATGASANAMPDLQFVKALIEAVDASGIDSLEITRAGTRVKISKTPPSLAGSGAFGFHGLAQAPVPAAVPASPSPPPVAPPPAAPNPVAAPVEAGAPVTDAAAGLIEVTSPMVGTFYRSQAPEAPAYVEVGTRITKGQTLCIIEAMKLMNELESEVEGVVRQVLVDNSEPVEYGQVLFRVDPNG